VFTTESEALAALNQYIDHLALMSASLEASIPLRHSRPPTAGRTLSEADRLEFVSRYGAPVVNHRSCESVD
jgi:hypothetical protein